jgi:hypothetical protein
MTADDPRIHTTPPVDRRRCCDGECNQGRDCPSPNDPFFTSLGYTTVTSIAVWILIGFMVWFVWSAL